MAKTGNGRRFPSSAKAPEQAGPGRHRPAKVEFTEEQAAMLARIDRELEGIGSDWIERQISWRRDLIARYQAEITELQGRQERLDASVAVIREGTADEGA